MAGQNDLGELSVTIGADTSKLDKSVPKVKKSLDDIKVHAKQAFSSAAIEAAGLLTAILGVAKGLESVVESISSTIEAADALSKLAQTLGISTDALGRLEVAAKQSDVEVETLTTGLKHLTDLMGQHGGLDQGPLLFSQLGISVKDAAGNIKSVDEVFAEAADKLAAMEDGVNKTNIAMALFGPRAAGLLPILNQGSAGLKQLGDEGKKTGGIMSKELIEAAIKFHDAMDKAKLIIQGYWNVVAEKLLPVLTSMAEHFDKTFVSLGFVSDAAAVLVRSFQAVYTVVTITLTAFQSLGNIAVGVFRSITDVAKGDFETAMADMKLSAEDVKKMYEDTGDSIQRIWGLLPAETKQAADQTKKNAAPIIQTADDIKNALSNMLADNSIDPSVKIQKLNAALAAGQIQWKEYGEDVDNALRPLNDFVEQNIGDAMSQNIMSATEQMDLLNDAVRRGQIGFRAYDKMAKQVYDSQRSNLEDLASATSQVIGEIFGKNKAAAIAQVIINTAVGISKALAQYPPPFGFAMAGLVAASGAAQLAAIKSTSQNGGGGSAPTAKGGGGGGGGGDTPASATPQQTLNVVGIDKNSLFSGDAVRGIVQTLIDYQKDGGKIVLGS